MKTLNFSKTARLIALVAGLVITQRISAQTITSTADGGNWAMDTTWVGGIVPTAANDVVIASGAAVVIRSPHDFSNPALCNSITIDGTLTLGSGSTSNRQLSVTSNVLVNSGGVLTHDGVNSHQIKVGGDFTNNGVFIPTLNTGSILLTFNGAGTQIIDSNDVGPINIDKTAGQVEVSSNVATLGITSITLTAGNFIAPTMMSISGNLTNNSGGFQAGSGTVIFNGTTQSIGGSVSTTFNNVTCNNNTSVTPTRTTTINGNLSIQNGATFNVGGFDFTVGGNTNVGNGSTGTLNFSSTTGNKLFTGLVTVSADGTWNNAIGENISFHGGITNNGTFTASTATCLFGVNSQAISGTVSVFRIEVEAGIALTNNGTVTVSSALAGDGNFVQGTDAVLNLGGTAGIVGLTANGAGNFVNYTGGTQSVRGINYVNLGLSGTDVKTLSGLTSSISGNFSLSGTASSTSIANLTIGGNLSLSGSSSFSMADDDIVVTGTTSVGVGSTLVVSSNVSSKTFLGTVAVNGTWNNSANETIHLEAGLVNNGTFNAGSGIYRFQTNSQSIEGTLTIPNVQVETGVNLTNNGTLTVTTDLSGAGTFTQGVSSVLNLAGTNSITSLNASGTDNTINYTGDTQTVRGINYVNLGLSGTGVKTLQPGTTNISGNLSISGTTSTTTVGTLGIGGNLSIASGCSMTNGNSQTLTLLGALTGDGTFIQETFASLDINGESSLALMDAAAANNAVFYWAASPSVIKGSYYDLMLYQSSGDAELGGNVSVNGTLFINSGSLNIENNHLTLGSTAAISIASPSASSMIITSGTGEVRKVFTAVGSFTFPIGDIVGDAEYTPMNVEVTSASGFTSAHIGVSVADDKHPNNNNGSYYLSRYWNVLQSGISNCEATIKAKYVAEDTAGVVSNIVAGQLDGTFNQLTNGWKKFAAVSNDTLTATGVMLTSGQSSAITGIKGGTPSVTIAGGDGPAVCVGTAVQLDAVITASTGGVFTHVWSPSTGLSQTNIGNPLAEPHSTTTYTVIIYDENGASATDETTITVQQPTVSVNDLEFCEGESGDLTATGAVTYTWSPSTGLSGTTGSVVTADPTVTTIYTVIGEDANLCTDTVTATVTVHPVPAMPTITPSDLNTDHPKLTSSSNTGNQWYRNEVAMEGETGKVLNVTEDGSYTVRVTTNGCEGPLSNAINVIVVGLLEDNLAAKSRIYPNPAQEYIQFNRSSFIPEMTIEVKVYDLAGRLQLTKVLAAGEASLEIKNLAKGQHFFIATQNNVIVVQKFIKN